MCTDNICFSQEKRKPSMFLVGTKVPYLELPFILSTDILNFTLLLLFFFFFFFFFFFWRNKKQIFT